MIEVSLQTIIIILSGLAIFCALFFLFIYLKIRSLKTEKSINKRMRHEIKIKTYENLIKQKVNQQSNQINQHLKNQE